MAKPNNRTIIHDPKFMQNPEAPIIRLPEDDIQYSTMAIGEEGDMRAVDRDVNIPQPVGLIAPPGWNEGKVLKPFDPGRVVLTMAIGENGEIAQPVGMLAPPRWQQPNEEVPVGLVAQPVWNTDKRIEEMMKAQIQAKELEAKQIDEIQTNKDLFNFQQLNHVSNEQVAAIQIANPNWKDQLKEWTASHKEEIQSMPVGMVAGPFPVRSDGDEVIVGRNAPGVFSDGMAGLLAAPNWNGSETDQVHVRGQTDQPWTNNQNTVEQNVPQISPNDQTNRQVFDYQRVSNLTQDQIEKIKSDTPNWKDQLKEWTANHQDEIRSIPIGAIAVQFPHLDDVGELVPDLSKFGQVGVAGIMAKESWDGTNKDQIQVSGMMNPSWDKTETDQAQVRGRMDPSVWPVAPTESIQPPISVEKAQWVQALGKENYFNYLDTHPVGVKEIIHGTALANQILGKDAVSAAIENDPSQAAMVAAKLVHFQQTSGWSTEKLHDYVKENANWADQLNEAVPDSQVLQPEVQPVGLVAKSDWESPFSPNSPFGIIGEPLVDFSATGPHSPYGVAKEQWMDGVGVEAVHKYAESEPESVGKIISGTALANEVFGYKVVDSAIAEDPSNAATIAVKLEQFQERSGWSTEKMQDYVKTNDNWEQQLNAEVNSYEELPKEENIVGLIASPGWGEGASKELRHEELPNKENHYDSAVPMHHESVIHKSTPVEAFVSANDNEPDPNHHKYNGK